jgi:hypothetical protein
LLAMLVSLAAVRYTPGVLASGRSGS